MLSSSNIPSVLLSLENVVDAMVMVGIVLMIIESDGAVNDDGWCGGDSELSFTCSFLTSLLSPRHFLARLPSFS